MYDPKSRQADDFINHQEIEDTLAYAEEHKSDRALIESLINKSLTFKGSPPTAKRRCFWPATFPTAMKKSCRPQLR